MKCIDFDQAFMRYLDGYLKAHKGEYRDYDAMEAAVPDIYQEYLNLPAEFLCGQKPGEYFQSYSDAKALVNWMEDYIKQRVPLPDMLLNRIVELGEPAERALMDTLHKERAPEEAKMTAVGLLRELDSVLPMELYIAWQLERENEDSLADNAIESLKNMGEAAYASMREALPRANDQGRGALLDALIKFPCTGDVFDAALDLFLRLGERAIYAGHLAALGDPRALPALLAAADDPNLTYLEYIEIRNAIEELGGDAPERVFDESDEFYAATRRIEEARRRMTKES